MGYAKKLTRDFFAANLGISESRSFLPCSRCSIYRKDDAQQRMANCQRQRASDISGAMQKCMIFTDIAPPTTDNSPALICNTAKSETAYSE